MAVVPGVKAWAAACPLEAAHYVVRDEQGVTAGFRVQGARLFFFVHAAGQDSTQWFLPGSKGRLISTGDITLPGWRVDGPSPVGALDYSATDENGGKLVDFYFHTGAPAPAHILIPRLQDVLHYGFVSDSREGLSLAFLDYDRCDSDGAAGRQ